MSAIEDVASRQGINGGGRDLLAAAFWIWFYNHQQDSVTIPVRIWLLHTEVKLTMLQLRPVFVLLFGEDPAH